MIKALNDNEADDLIKQTAARFGDIDRRTAAYLHNMTLKIWPHGVPTEKQVLRVLMADPAFMALLAEWNLARLWLKVHRIEAGADDDDDTDAA
jgi:hypothetical protein